MQPDLSPPPTDVREMLTRDSREEETDVRNYTRLASLADNAVSSLMEDRQGVLWVGTPSGISRFDEESGVFVRYQHDPADPGSLGHNAVRVLALQAPLTPESALDLTAADSHRLTEQPGSS